MGILKYFLLFVSIILIFGTVYSLEIVSPETYDDNTLVLYPGMNVNISFLKQESGLQIFIDDINCTNVFCSKTKLNGPYYDFNVVGQEGNGEIKITYHLKGQDKEKSAKIKVNISQDSLSVLVLMPTNAKFLQKTPANIFILNNSDLDLSGKVFSNFPDKVFPPVDFNISAKTKKEIATYFYPQNPGYYNIIFYREVNDSKTQQKLAEQTLKVSMTLNDYLSLPIKSFLPTNPVLELYSSIIYFISKFA